MCESIQEENIARVNLFCSSKVNEFVDFSVE